MRIFFLIILINLLTSLVVAEEIKIKFNKESSKHWGYISDRTMGGISNGQAFLDQEGNLKFATLKGNVSTANNGGFIQLRSTLSFIDINNLERSLDGVRLMVRGNGETYHIFIRTSKTRSYRDFYYATFIANENWELVDLPFKKFKHRFSESSLKGDDIRTFAIVAYGRDFVSDVSISEIIFYN
tara:strand:+ start:2406 stop:2957 length:552 start_codon:yes stop_codon:yes gene_type:complete